MNILFIGNGFDLAHGIKIEFKDFVKWIIDKKKLNCRERKLFSDEEYKKQIENENLWSKFEEYLGFLIKNKIKDKRFIKKINKLFEEWFDSQKDFFQKQFKNNEFIEKIIKEKNIKSIISLNFTNTPEKYNFKEFVLNKNNDVTNFNNEKSISGKYICLHKFHEGTKYVLGNDSFQNIKKEKFLVNLSNDRRDSYFKKSFLNTLYKYDKIIFFGLSFGESDLDLVHFVRSKSWNLNLEFYCKTDEDLKRVKFILNKKTKKVNFIKLN